LTYGGELSGMPTKITKCGFFSEEAFEESEAIQREHKQLFFHLDDLNVKAHIHLGGFPLGLKQLKPVLTATLFMRGLTAYQAMILLAQKGFASETRATCRNILDAKFRLAYILTKPDADVLLIAKSAGRAKRLEAQQTGKLRALKDFGTFELDALIRQAETNQKDSSGKRLKLPPAEKIAEACGLDEEYLGPYSILSEATHSGVVELESYLKLSPDGNMVEQYLYGPQDGAWVGWNYTSWSRIPPRLHGD
jgi:Family of unknown function (DUF5677)